MPKYCVNRRSYIGGCVVEPGEIVEYDGKPGSNLDPVDKAAAAAKAAVAKGAVPTASKQQTEQIEALNVQVASLKAENEALVQQLAAAEAERDKAMSDLASVTQAPQPAI